jgi:hypothetical protein
MYKKIMLIASMTGFALFAENENISTILENCQTIINTLQQGNIEEVQELLEQNLDMKEALLISLVASQRQ